MIILGVTGSIASGKSYACSVLSSFSGVRIISSDDMVHFLYQNDEELVNHIYRNHSEAIIDNEIDRKKLGEFIFNNPIAKKHLEDIIFPKLKILRQEFVKNCIKTKAKLVVFEIPLLFENSLQGECDYVLTIFCNKIIQKQRVLRRWGMTEAKFNSILKSQMPVHKKLKLSDFSINSGAGKANTIKELRTMLKCIEQVEVVNEV